MIFGVLWVEFGFIKPCFGLDAIFLIIWVYGNSIISVVGHFVGCVRQHQ
jgi:hypothetical protein